MSSFLMGRRNSLVSNENDASQPRTYGASLGASQPFASTAYGATCEPTVGKAQLVQPPRRYTGILGDITNANSAIIELSKPSFSNVCVGDETCPTFGFAAGLAAVASGGCGACCHPEQPASVCVENHFRNATRSSSRCCVFADSTANTEYMDVDDDILGVHDSQSVAEYAQSIHANLLNAESKFLPRPGFLDKQTDINAKMRGILVDWLVEVHRKYKLKTETLFLTVNIVDRYLERKQPSRKQLQLVGVACMFIAAKFEEIHPPDLRDFVYITDSAYTKNEILNQELVVVTVLKFVLCSPTAAHFLELYSRVNHCNEAHFYLMQYVLELSLVDHNMSQYSPAHMTAAAVLLTNKLLKKQPAWPDAMAQQSNLSELAVKACAREMCGLLEAAERSPLQAVRRKFSQPKYCSVAKNGLEEFFHA